MIGMALYAPLPAPLHCIGLKCLKFKIQNWTIKLLQLQFIRRSKIERGGDKYESWNTEDFDGKTAFMFRKVEMNFHLGFLFIPLLELGSLRPHLVRYICGKPNFRFFKSCNGKRENTQSQIIPTSSLDIYKYEAEIPIPFNYTVAFFQSNGKKQDDRMSVEVWTIWPK